MNIDFNNMNKYIAVCPTGEITVKKLTETDIGQLAELYGKLLITKENYKEKLGMTDYDNFYSFGGKYQVLTSDDFHRMVKDDSWLFLGAYYQEKLVGAIWATVNKDFFADMENFNFKKEYGGVGRIWERHLEKAGIPNNLETVCEAPSQFPSLLAVLHYLLVQHYLSNGVEATVSLIYKNISCKGEGEERNLDTFNYGSYNAYKMLGYEHVGNLPLTEVSIADNSLVVTVEPQLIAGLDLYLQNLVITKILEEQEISIKEA